MSAAKLLVGWIGHSTAVFADGLENAGDLFGSGLILYALHVASALPDKEHPYGHGPRRAGGVRWGEDIRAKDRPGIPR